MKDFREKVINLATKNGEIKKYIDGYYYFLPSENTSYLSSPILRILGEHLDELNKEWHQTILDMEKDYGKQKA